MVVNLMLQNYLYGRVRWPFMSELYEYVQGVYLAKAIVAVVAKPRKPTFNVTAKGISLDADHLSSLAKPFIAIFAVLLLGVATAFYRYFTQPGAELMLIVGLWTSFNLVIAGVALGVVAERREPDRFPRLAIDRTGTIAIGTRAAPVTIHSVSAGGCSLRFVDPAAMPADLTVEARATLTVDPLHDLATSAPLQIELVHATETDATTFGFAFVAMDASSYLALADLMYGDPGAILRFQTKRRAHKNLLVGSWQFLKWGVLEPRRAIVHLLPTRRRAVPIAPVADIAAIPVLETTMLAVVAEPVPVPGAVLAVVASHEASIALAPAVATDDFDSLATTLAEARADDHPVDKLAGWMHAVLSLAAQEMKRDTSDRECADAPTSVAA